MSDAGLETDTFSEIVELVAFEEELQCEMKGHNNPKQSKYHEGPGVWVGTLICPMCSHTVQHLICDKHKVFLETDKDLDNFSTCENCSKSRGSFINGFTFVRVRA